MFWHFSLGDNMRAKKFRKIFSFSEEEIISAVLHDISLYEKKTESEIVEAILLGLRPALFPSHPLASEYIATLYANVDNEVVLKETYRRLFAYVSASLDGQIRLPNLLPLVELLRSMSWNKHDYHNSKLSVLPHLKTQWTCMLDYITYNNLHKLNENSLEWFECKQDIDYGKDLLDSMNGFPDDSSLIANMLDFVINWWDSVSNYNRTYRLLMDISILVYPENTVKNRRAFSDCLFEISQSWNNKV